MVGLPATGELSYEGYTFDASARINVTVNMIKDDAGIAIVAHEIVLRVRSVVAVSTGTDASLLDIRQRLGRSGGRLIFINKGFGDDLRVNAGTVRDIKNGPTPNVLLWSSLGDDKAAEIEWEVVTTVPPCPRYARFFGISALHWATSWSIDAGETTRSISGYIEIALNKLGQDTADEYRHHFVTPPIEGFNRKWSWDLSLDQRRIDFVITDTQIESDNAYPLHVIEIDATHRMSYRRTKEAIMPRHSLTATIKMERGWTGAAAWQVFLEIVQQRVGQRKSKQAKSRGPKTFQQSPFLLGLDVEEQIFGREHSFRLEYWILSEIADLIGHSNLWTPVGTRWDLWTRSLGDTVFHQRGQAQLRDIAANHAVVDLCTSVGANISNNLRVDTIGRRPPQLGTLENEQPEQEKSYLRYDIDISVQRYRPTARLAPLQEPEQNIDDGAYDAAGASTIGPGDYGSKGGEVSDTIQIGGRPRYSVSLTGKAVRAGYEIARPTLKTVGTETPVEARNWFPQKKVGNFFGIPVYAAMWRVDYLLEGNPGVVELPLDQQDLAV